VPRNTVERERWMRMRRLCPRDDEEAPQELSLFPIA
jgi:hypothetical protein